MALLAARAFLTRDSLLNQLRNLLLHHDRTYLVDCAVVDCHSMSGHAVLFFQLGVQKVERLRKVLRTSFQALFEEVSGSLQLFTSIALQKLCEIRIPNVEDVRPAEERDAFFIGLKGLLKIVVLFKKEPIVDDDLWSSDFEVEDAVVDSLRGGKRAKTLLQVGVQRPHFQGLVQSHL